MDDDVGFYDTKEEGEFIYGYQEYEEDDQEMYYDPYQDDGDDDFFEDEDDCEEYGLDVVDHLGEEEEEDEDVEEEEDISMISLTFALPKGASKGVIIFLDFESSMSMYPVPALKYEAGEIITIVLEKPENPKLIPPHITFAVPK